MLLATRVNDPFAVEICVWFEQVRFSSTLRFALSQRNKFPVHIIMHFTFQPGILLHEIPNANEDP